MPATGKRGSRGRFPRPKHANERRSLPFYKLPGGIERERNHEIRRAPRNSPLNRLNNLRFRRKFERFSRERFTISYRVPLLLGPGRSTARFA